MTQWPHDNQEARNAFYGDPGKGQIGPQMVPVVPPFAMYYEGRLVKAIQFHKKAAPALLAALNEIWDYCQHDQAKIDASGASKYFGAYNHRMVRGSSTKWSNHAYAAAIDLNAGQNALGAVGNMPHFIVDAFCRQGAMWGGWYAHRPDWMHFEFVDNGGRVPASPPPAAVHQLGIMGVKPLSPTGFGDEDAAPIVAPADDIEPHPPLPSFLQKKDDPVIVDGDVKGDPELYSVQKRLKAMNYSPGVLDGVWGGGTSGAISGFINDRGGQIAVPASLDAFNDVRDQIKAELGRAESESPRFTRPVSPARKAGDAATVATIAPEVVGAKRNFLAAVWAAIVAAFGSVWNTISGWFTDAWNFFTDHKDDLPDDGAGLLSTAWGYVTQIPAPVWWLAAAGLFVFLAMNARSSVKKITESVQSGARQ